MEVLLTEKLGGANEWGALVKPAKKVPVGETLEFAAAGSEEVLLRARWWVRESLGSGRCGSRRWRIFMRCWSGLGICHCRRIFGERKMWRIERRIGSGIRRCIRGR